MALYLIKINLAIALLYIVYRLLFREDTFFRLRRFTLIGILLLAVLFPLPDLSHWVSQQPLLNEYVHSISSFYQSDEVSVLAQEMEMIEAGTEGVVAETAASPAGVDWKNHSGKVAIGLYLIGILVLIFRCMAELVSLYRTYSGSRRAYIDGVAVQVSSKVVEPYSFFHWIFIDPDKYHPRMLSEILIHEATHVRQFHSIDVVLSELITILCWMNPFAWLLKREISINHEYIADQEVMNAGFNKKEYQYHLIGVIHSPVAAANLYNYFSVLPLKKRITMLNKNRMHRVGVMKYLALVPLAASLLVANNIEVMARILPSSQPLSAIVETASPLDEVMLPDDDKIYTAVDEMPEFPGGGKELMTYLTKNIKYPQAAHEAGIEGRVIVSFVVEKEGKITNCQVVKSVDPALDQEALRLINTFPAWTPGKNNGEVVRTKYTLPISFQLKKKSATESNNNNPIHPEKHKGEVVYSMSEVMPEYPGGISALLAFLNQHVKYTEHAKQNKIEGRVIVAFVVEKDGTPANFKIIKSLEPSLDNETLRVVSLMEKWNPGTKDGEPVQVRYVLPVQFKL